MKYFATYKVFYFSDRDTCMEYVYFSFAPLGGETLSIVGAQANSSS